MKQITIIMKLRIIEFCKQSLRKLFFNKPKRFNSKEAILSRLSTLKEGDKITFYFFFGMMPTTGIVVSNSPEEKKICIKTWMIDDNKRTYWSPSVYDYDCGRGKWENQTWYFKDFLLLNPSGSTIPTA